MFQYVLLKISQYLIWAYQRIISFDHGPLRHITGTPRCKYYPTCSEYAKQALLKYGIIKGTAMTAWRLLRCNPFSAGGIDEA